MRIERRKASPLSSSVPVWRFVRWGRRLVETAWKSCRGARAIIRMLKMNPAAAAPSVARIRSGPALRKVCSLSMISRTAAANPVPWASDISGAAESPPPRAARAQAAGASALRARRRNAAGTTTRLRHGAATIPIATTSWPLASPTATITANEVRKIDSERIRIEKRPKERIPAR